VISHQQLDRGERLIPLAGAIIQQRIQRRSLGVEGIRQAVQEVPGSPPPPPRSIQRAVSDGWMEPP
jgi:hypothetical protein